MSTCNMMDRVNDDLIFRVFTSCWHTAWRWYAVLDTHSCSWCCTKVLSWWEQAWWQWPDNIVQCWWCIAQLGPMADGFYVTLVWWFGCTHMHACIILDYECSDRPMPVVQSRYWCHVLHVFLGHRQEAKPSNSHHSLHYMDHTFIWTARAIVQLVGP